MSLFGEDALVAYETFSVLLKYLGVNPPISCDRKRTRLPYRCVNILSIVLSTLFYGYLLFSISLDSGVLKAGIKSLIVTRMHDLYFVLRYITVIVVQVHVLNNGGEINRLLRALNSISNAVTLLANRKGVSSKLRFFGTVRFAKGLRVFSLSYPFVCLAITFTILKWLNWNQLIGHVFQFVRLLYFTTYVHLWLQATLAAMLVLSRYEALKDLFGMYFPTSPSAVGNPSEFAICSEKEQINVLKQIKILHDKLNDVVELVNYCFSVQITFCVGLCFVIGVVCSFGLFRAFIYRNELFYMGVLNFIWYMYYLFFVLFFIAVGSKITREGKRIGILVHKAINCSSSSAVINELNLFSQQLLHRSPVITCGLFVYDWTLWYTMIGATATYLIILIQFDVSFPNLVNVNATAVYRGST
ncbi:gustatory receptor for sugar taste 43a-like isoform X4 [Anopheles merus]|uniref:gustatory receptor for sugar taste 43a-like isoform X4 n=1 Tax=Anopheles merus TaxID=30066 RepID=UPI001BE4D0E4|nr:gustatory receptor for sugar taste 43a-like isoform X4 [Anopheles merus]